MMNIQEPMLRIAVSTRALFDLEKENRIFEEMGAEYYIGYQKEHEKEVLPKGPAFQLVEALLRMSPKVEIILMSKNSAEVSLRIFHSIEAYGLNITKATFTTGRSIVPYLSAFNTDLYLSANRDDVAGAVSQGMAAGLIMTDRFHSSSPISEIRIAFDGDAVIFSDESEQLFKALGVEAFNQNEHEKALMPLPEGPFAHFLKTISLLQQEYPFGECPIRTALVTARCAPAHERVIRTLRKWGVRIDESFFLGGLSKTAILQAFGAHIFFDDSAANIETASSVVLSAMVPYPADKGIPSKVA
ncbi:MAG: 5'-nucleotidase [Lachnospiraceae bacterium]|nr:5'-nucleotidase [Lachnospiraceae bacterium]